MLSALRKPGLRWIVSIHAADLTLEFASSVALMVFVYDATDSPIAASLMLIAKQVLPGALAAVLGRVLDSVDVRAGLAAAYLARGAMFALLAAGDQGVALYLLAFGAGAAGVASRVLIRATVVRSTSGRAFREVSAAQNVIFGAVALAGPALGALAAGGVGANASLAGWAAFAVALAFVAATVPASLRSPKSSVSEADAALEATTVAADSGLRAPLWSLLALGATLTCVLSMDEPALLAYSRDALGGDVGTYGTILVAWGVGMLLGGVAYTRYGVAAPFRAIVAGVLANSVGYIGLGFAPTFEVACAAAVIGGAGNGTYWVALVTAVLERAPVGEEAKASGQLEGMATAMPAIGFLLGGVLAELVAPRVTLWLPGLVSAAALGAWVLVARRTEPAAAITSSTPSRAAPAVSATEVVGAPASSHQANAFEVLA